MMLDLLHRSRMQFPAMGFLNRIQEEATRHCRERLVGGKNLFGYDQIQSRLPAPGDLNPAGKLCVR